jgi:NAD(P)-dependent dehydrogenase (short-subunit alcohol dehydrogenase family)
VKVCLVEQNEGATEVSGRSGAHLQLINKVALVTGVSSGIGQEIARLLAEHGARVFGTVRNHQPPNAIAGVQLVRMDVTNEPSVANAVQSVLEQAGAIHVLVNNAGYALAGGLEETSIQEAQQQFDTNFFGVLRVSQAVLPVMRRQGYGRIVNISSMNGLLPAPYRGIYAASKHALEGYTETLDHEVRQFGIRAVLIEPVFTKTDISRNERSTQIRLEAYADQRRRVEEVIYLSTVDGDEPRAVAKVVYRALTTASPRLHYPVGEGIMLSRMRRFVPPRLFDRVFRRRYQLDTNSKNENRKNGNQDYYED